MENESCNSTRGIDMKNKKYTISDLDIANLKTYVVDTTKPPIGPPSITVEFGLFVWKRQTAASIIQDKMYDDYIKHYNNALANSYVHTADRVSLPKLEKTLALE